MFSIPFANVLPVSYLLRVGWFLFVSAGTTIGRATYI